MCMKLLYWPGEFGDGAVLLSEDAAPLLRKDGTERKSTGGEVTPGD